jgi:DNA-binding transcriptional LysR family regulator
MFDWNDLKYFLAVARHGSTIAAGKALGTSQSTVHRRLEELERRIGQALVTRAASGYRLTEYGTTLLPFAERIEAAVGDFQRRATDTEQDMKGAIRVTCPEPIVIRMTQSGLIERFHARHPHLRVEFITSDRYLDLSKGEVDIAFRSGDTDDELIGRKIAWPSTQAMAMSNVMASPSASRICRNIFWSASTKRWPIIAPRSG